MRELHDRRSDLPDGDDESVALLTRLSIFANASQPAIHAAAGRSVFRNYPRDAVLFRAGEPCTGLHVVAAGRVRVYRANAHGREQVLHAQGPGQALAEVPLFDAGPYPASARAVEPSRVLFLPIDQFQYLYRTYPEIADSIIHELGRRLRRAVRLIEKISLKDVAARVALTLLDYAEAAGARSDGGEFELPRTQEELAAELATTRESVARALSRLRAEGIISQSGSRIAIRKLEELEELGAGF